MKRKMTHVIIILAICVACMVPTVGCGEHACDGCGNCIGGCLGVGCNGCAAICSGCSNAVSDKSE